jgi:hypothetical protein
MRGRAATGLKGEGRIKAGAGGLIHLLIGALIHLSNDPMNQ